MPENAHRQAPPEGYNDLTDPEKLLVRLYIRWIWYKKQLRLKAGGNFTIWRIIHAVTVVMLIRFIVHLCAGCDAPLILARTFHPMIIIEGLALCVFMPRIYPKLPPAKLSDNGGGEIRA